MGDYFEKICIFMCFLEMLCQFLPAKKYMKLYRSVAGIIILLMVMEPLGESFFLKINQQENSLTGDFEKEFDKQDIYWEWEETFWKQIEKENIEQWLKPYGYEGE